MCSCDCVNGTRKSKLALALNKEQGLEVVQESNQ